MKILHLTKYYPPETGGMETFLAGLAEEQARQGHAVRVLAHHSRRGLPTVREDRSGVAVTRARILRNIAFAPISSAFFRELGEQCRKFKPDILHVHMPNVSAFWALWPTITSAVVIHWHADVVTDRQPGLKVLYPAYAVAEKRLLQRAKRVIVTSSNYLDSSTPLEPYRDKCRVVPLGLDTGRIPQVPDAQANALRKRYGGAKLVIAVGRFSYYKGFEYLVRAAAQLPDTAVVIVGQGPLHESCRKLAVELGVENRVFFPGAVSESELWQHYAAADVVCLPSIERTEAFGMVLLEAMAFGKPLVTTRVPGSGMSLVNVHEVTGLQAEPQDPESLARALRTILNNPGQARAMGRTGHKRLCSRFSMQAVALQVQDLYESI